MLLFSALLLFYVFYSLKLFFTVYLHTFLSRIINSVGRAFTPESKDNAQFCLRLFRKRSLKFNNWLLSNGEKKRYQYYISAMTKYRHQYRLLTNPYRWITNYLCTLKCLYRVLILILPLCLLGVGGAQLFSGR